MAAAGAGLRWVILGVVTAALLGCAEKIAEPAPPTAPQAPAPAEPPPVPAAPVAKPLPARRFLKVEGNVKVDGAKAVEGVEFSETATIETAKDARAIITLGKGSIVDVRSGSRLVLGTSPRAKISVKLILGALGSIMPEGSSYEVIAPTAVAGVRGTIFFVEANKKKETYVCACHGNVAMQAANPKSFDQVVSSPNYDHNGYTFITKGKKQLAKKTARHGHTDADAEMILPYLKAVQ